MHFTLRAWLARLSFTLFILCGILLWESYRAAHGQLGQVSAGRITLWMIGALLSFVLACVGVRERHRPDRDDEL
jgi:hypothetical protein